ncbi:hypothetical protein JCM11251_000751 [Rhodosporidiobolus azoricus]
MYLGSYKRVNPSAHLDPSTAVQRVHSQLARRVAQEVEMFVERAKSWPVVSKRDLAEPPVSRMTEEEWEAELRELEKAPADKARRKRRVVAVLDLSSSPSSPSTRPSRNYPIFSGRSIPSYRLPSFFADVRLPPSALPSTVSPDTAPPASKILIADIRSRLDELIKVWQQRATRNSLSNASSSLAASSTLSPPTPPSNTPLPSGDVYVLCTPALPSSSVDFGIANSPEDAIRRRQAEDVVPLLVALKRCSLWNGEAWEDGGEVQ